MSMPELRQKTPIQLAEMIHNAGYSLGVIFQSAIVDEDGWLAAIALASKIKAEPKVTFIHVVKDGEWGEFFVREHPVVTDSSGTRYSATFTCNTSFGVYGYHWSSMGLPFPEFAAKIGSDYLLGKIGGERKPSAKLIVTGVKKQILTQRYEGQINAEDAREAWEFVDECDAFYGDQEIGAMIYSGMPDGVEINFEFSHTEYDMAAQIFVEKLWPLFVRELQRPNGK